MPSHVAVIGGGITGLSAAYQLISTGHRVSLFEREPSLGGKIAEVTLDGLAIPSGPDAFLARRPEVTDLATEVGLGHALTTPSARSARIYRDGALHVLPPNVLGVPATSDLATSGLISPAGAAVAAEGQGEPPTAADESVGALVRRQLGDEVLEYLVDPLLGGINAGDSDRLSVVSGVPQLDALRQRGGRLLDAAAATIDAAALRDPVPVFHSIEGGIGRLVDRVVELLEASDEFELHPASAAVLERTDGRWKVNGLDVDHVISTIPAHASAELIADLSASVADLLVGIEYSSVALTIMTLAPHTLDVDESVSGVLVPRLAGHHVTAVSIASHKWPHLAIRGRQVLRVSVGRRTDSRWVRLGDDELVKIIERDLSEIFNIEVQALDSVVTRWMRSLPQYDVGHLDVLARIDDELGDLPGLQLTGAWRSGLGLPACVGAGRRAADIVNA